MATVVDTLEFWHPTKDELLDENYLDWGQVARSSSGDRLVRVRNMSYSYTARGIEVYVQEIGVADPVRSVAAQQYLSFDGDVFKAFVQVGDLAPQTNSLPIIVRRVTASDADLGFGDFQLHAHATSWA